MAIRVISSSEDLQLASTRPALYCLLMICKAYEAFEVVANIWVLDPVNGWCAFQADEKLGAETCW